MIGTGRGVRIRSSSNREGSEMGIEFYYGIVAACGFLLCCYWFGETYR